MKKFLSVILVGFMMLSVGLYPAETFASDDTKTVLSLVKSRIPDTSAYTEFDSSVNVRGSVSEYHFNWSFENDGMYGSMSVTALSDGLITSYSVYSNTPKTNAELTLNKMSSDDAMEKAVMLADKLNPELSGSLVLSKINKYESLANDGYMFSVQRMQNGIPVYGDTGSVSVNADCTAIENFYINYTSGIEFPSSDNVISKEAAIENYRSKIGLELYYATSYRNSEDKTAYLSYRPSLDNVYIDAVSGETVEPVRQYGYRGGYESSKNEAAADTLAGAGFTKAEISNLAELENLMSVDDAGKIVKNNKYIKTDGTLRLKSQYTYKNYEEEYEHNLQYYTDSELDDYVDVTLNAKSGEILSVYQRGNYQYSENTKEVSTDAIKQIVSYFAPLRYNTNETGEYRFYKQSGNSCEFVRYVNNIPYYDNRITVSVNPEDNSLISYSLNHSENIEFMSSDGIISEYEACTSLFEKLGYSPCYFPCVSSEKSATNDKAELVYMLEDGGREVYADSGELVSYSEEPEIGNYTDIDGHYAEDIINTLSKFGVGFEEEAFRPDDIITQKEFVALLTSVVSNNNSIIVYKDTDYDNFYRRAQNRNIIKDGEKSPDSEITRKSACIYFIRAIGLEKAAELEGIYISGFSDVNSDIGYISILSAMGVVSGYNGVFNPQNPLSRADAMIMIYNYLK